MQTCSRTTSHGATLLRKSYNNNIICNRGLAVLRGVTAAVRKMTCVDCVAIIRDKYIRFPDDEDRGVEKKLQAHATPMARDVGRIALTVQ